MSSKYFEVTTFSFANPYAYNRYSNRFIIAFFYKNLTNDLLLYR